MRDKKPLVDQFKIHFFAIKWLQKLQTPVPYNSEEFAEDCFKLGFDMNCGYPFKFCFEDESVFYQSEALKRVIEHIEDVKLLCSAIFSRWRDIQFRRIKEGFHAEQSRAEQSRESFLSEEETAWFSIALKRLAAITDAENSRHDKPTSRSV